MARHATLSQGTKWALCLLSVLLGSCAAPSRVEQSGLSFSQEPLLGKVIWSDLVTDDVIFAATGVTDGSIVAGVKRYPGYLTTETILMRSKTGSVRRMTYRNPVK